MIRNSKNRTDRIGELMAVTIRDVAREAGVSITTVSHALTGYPDVARKTREKIEEAAHRLGYQPNINGRNLASKRSNRIALIIADLLEREPRDHTTFRMIQGVYSYCSTHDLEVAVYAQDPKEMTYSQFCRCHAVEGALLSDMRAGDADLADLMEMPIPFVAMNVEFLEPGQNISIDNTAAAADMTRLLLKNGHRKILVAVGPQDSIEQADRMIGVLAAVEQAELSLQEEDILCCDPGEQAQLSPSGEEQQAYRKMKEYLSCYGAGRHTAVLCFGDYMALGVRKAIREAGYRIPEDFSLTGFGGSVIGEYMEPALTTVEWDPLDCGYAAAELLHRRMQRTAAEQGSPVPYRIVDRDSVKRMENA